MIGQLPITRRQVAECIVFSLGGFAIAVIIFALAIWLAVDVFARDLGQWDQNDPATRQWFKDLKQPDYPAVSCCGEADAYWADSYEVSPNGEYVAIITDDRNVFARPEIPVGTKIVVPKNKIKWDKGNPTGHGIIFVANAADPYSPEDGSGWIVFCYLPPMGT